MDRKQIVKSSKSSKFRI